MPLPMPSIVRSKALRAFLSGSCGWVGKTTHSLEKEPRKGFRMEDKSREIMEGLMDAIKNGDAQIIGVAFLDECDDACVHPATKEDKERFEKIIDALCCALIHDNDSATCMFNQWRVNKVRLEGTYKREEDGRITTERAEQVRENCRVAMTEFETAFINALYGEYYDLLEPMPLQNRDVASVVRGRFIKNYAMIEDES